MIFIYSETIAAKGSKLLVPFEEQGLWKRIQTEFELFQVHNSIVFNLDLLDLGSNFVTERSLPPSHVMI
jgi:hypothetical protein